jgi:hypothetical protein
MLLLLMETLSLTLHYVWELSAYNFTEALERTGREAWDSEGICEQMSSLYIYLFIFYF